jgi:hypothetical protein
MQIEIFSGFSKKHDSTRRPATAGTVVNVLLKDGADIKNPIFELNTLDFSINYVKAFNQYYFAHVQNIDGHRCNIICELDHLATFKPQIGGYTGLIEYTSSSDKVDILDPRNTPRDLITMSATGFTLSGININTVGGYIVGVLSNNPSGDVGVIDYYTMTATQMRAFCTELYDQGFIQRIVDQFQAVQDSLVSCIWVPLTGIGGASTPIHIGRETMNATGGKVSDRIISFGSGLTTLNFSANSGGAGAAMTYLEKAPYCSGALYLPFVGFVPIDMDIAAFTKSIQLDGYVDILTGDIVYNVKYGAARVSSYSGNLATKVPVSGAGYDAIGVSTGLMTVVGGAAAAIGGLLTAGIGTAVAGGVAAAVGGGVSAAKSAEFHTMINGSNSSAIGASLGTSPYAIIIQNEPSETDLTAFKASHGMPYYEVASIGSLSGYVKCFDASISIPGDGSEQDVVNGYLNSGFYYE